MPDESSLESNDVYRFDEQTAAYRTRMQNAMSAYRQISRPRNFRPPAPAPGDDPPPSPDPEDSSELESNSVGYYDGLTMDHRTKTSSELGRFASALSGFAQVYKKWTGRDYVLPASSVPEIDVTDDENEYRLESNTVSAYDATIPGYLTLTDDFKGDFGTNTDTYQDRIDSANDKLDVLNGTGASSVYQKMKDLARRIHDITQ